jgi:hypothetical protein
MVGATGFLLAAAVLLQLAFYGHGGHSALSDLPRVYLHRGVGPGGVPYIDRVIEYPVASGFLLYVAALIAPGSLGVLPVTALSRRTARPGRSK